MTADSQSSQAEPQINSMQASEYQGGIPPSNYNVKKDEKRRVWNAEMNRYEAAPVLPTPKFEKKIPVKKQNE